MFQIALDTGTGVDIHLHDAGHLGVFEIERIAHQHQLHRLAIG